MGSENIYVVVCVCYYEGLQYYVQKSRIIHRTEGSKKRTKGVVYTTHMKTNPYSKQGEVNFAGTRVANNFKVPLPTIY